MAVLTSYELGINEMISVTTDGVPAMVGTVNGLAGRLRSKKPNHLTLHCIKHVSVLCAKLDPEFSPLMDSVIKMINYLNSQSALRHHQLQLFSSPRMLSTMSFSLTTTSAGSLQRMWAIRHHLIKFLATVVNRAAQAAHYHEMLVG